MIGMVSVVTRNSTVAELSMRFERDDFYAYPVVDDGDAIGVVTIR
jgi:predicted transcriptional regulator